MSDPKGNVLLYIDNSNIFINTQIHSAKLKKYRPKIQDVCCRIEIGKLVNKVCGGRDVVRGKLYGSEPPALDSVWKAIRMKQIEVYTSHRSTWNDREKETDTKLTAHAVEDIVSLKVEGGPDYVRTVILLTGDKDMRQVVQTAQKHKWRVEIWSYEKALSKDLGREAENNPCVKICLLDDVFKEITSYKYYLLRGRVAKERSIVIKHDDIKMGEIGNRKRRDMVLRNVVDICNRLFKLPTLAGYIDPKSFDLCVFLCTSEGKGDKRLYSFEKLWRDIIASGELKNNIENCSHTLTLHEYLQADNVDDLNLNEVGDDFVVDMDDPEYFDDNDDEYTLVNRKERQKSSQRYSEVCVKRFACRAGPWCHYKHNDLEKEYFKTQPDGNRRLKYKTVECSYAENCRYVKNEKQYLCSYAHSVTEVRCFRCREIGLHYTDECPLQRGTN